MKGEVPLQTWKSPSFQMILDQYSETMWRSLRFHVSARTRIPSQGSTSFYYFFTDKVRHPRSQVEKLNKWRTLLTQHKVVTRQGTGTTYGNRWLALSRKATQALFPSRRPKATVATNTCLCNSAPPSPFPLATAPAAKEPAPSAESSQVPLSLYQRRRWSSPLAGRTHGGYTFYPDDDCFSWEKLVYTFEVLQKSDFQH